MTKRRSRIWRLSHGWTCTVICGISFCCVAQGAPTAAEDCLVQPTARCLVQQALAGQSTLDKTDPLYLELQTELQFEAPKFQLSSRATQPLSEGDNDSIALRALLEQEEAFLFTLKQGDFENGEKILATLPSALHDYTNIQPSALFIEYLILALKDREADIFKKKYYENLVAEQNPVRIQRMLEVAQNEVLGGQPAKAINTLSNINIDEFSAAEFFSSKTAVVLIATQSEQLFLRPNTHTNHCDKPSDVAATLQYFLNREQLTLQQKINDLPDSRLRIRTRLALARLYHNSEQCVLLQRWLTGLAIQEAIQENSGTASNFIQLIHLARAIRRYQF